MKGNFASKWIGAGTLALSLAVLPSTLSASAQVNSDPTTQTAPNSTAPGSMDSTSPGSMDSTSPNSMDSTTPGTMDPTTSDPVSPGTSGTVDPTVSDPSGSTNPNGVTSDPTVPGTTYPDQTAPTTTTTVEDDGVSWGWLGLLGLIGLAGLVGRNSDRAATYRTDDRVTTHTSTDPRI